MIASLRLPGGNGRVLSVTREIGVYGGLKWPHLEQ
jgi:hypothetical protein